MAGVSIRKSIRWLPHDAQEPTSTIVLSSAGRRFVDIRVLTSAENNVTDQAKKLDLKHLDWAIAGTSSSTPVPARGPNVKLATFKHWIDSRTLDVESATDEGFMYPHGTEGKDELVLEIGNMVNPETGLPTDYEEIWIEKEPEPVPDDDGSQVLVLNYEGSESNCRGSIVRVGRFCQGLLRIKDQITAERWEWDEKKGWWQSKAIGKDDLLPCEMILKPFAGDTIEHNGITWDVVERSKI